MRILDNIVLRAFDKSKEELSQSSSAGEVIDGMSVNLVRSDLGFVEKGSEQAVNLAGAPAKVETATVGRNIEQAAWRKMVASVERKPPVLF
jgi:hypothetical protein